MNVLLGPIIVVRMLCVQILWEATIVFASLAMREMDSYAQVKKLHENFYYSQPRVCSMHHHICMFVFFKATMNKCADGGTLCIQILWGTSVILVLSLYKECMQW